MKISSQNESVPSFFVIVSVEMKILIGPYSFLSILAEIFWEKRTSVERGNGEFLFYNSMHNGEVRWSVLPKGKLWNFLLNSEKLQFGFNPCCHDLKQLEEISSFVDFKRTNNLIFFSPPIYLAMCI